MGQTFSLKQLNEAPLKQGEPLRHGGQRYARRMKAERAQGHFCRVYGLCPCVPSPCRATALLDVLRNAAIVKQS
jgi:hypothetical protein